MKALGNSSQGRLPPACPEPMTDTASHHHPPFLPRLDSLSASFATRHTLGAATTSPGLAWELKPVCCLCRAGCSVGGPGVLWCPCCVTPDAVASLLRLHTAITWGVFKLPVPGSLPGSSILGVGDMAWASGFFLSPWEFSCAATFAPFPHLPGGESLCPRRPRVSGRG